MQTTLDAWLASSCDLKTRKRLRSASGGIHPTSHLLSCSFCPDLWEIICNHCTGDSISTLAAMSEFADATKATWAWQLLSGLNDDAELVPWNDADNCLSIHYIPTPLRMGPTDRNSLIFRLTHYMLGKQPCPYFKHQLHGPARPSTPCNGFKHANRKLARTSCPTYYAYVNAHERCDCSKCRLNRPGDMGSPVFGIRPGYSFAPFWDVLIGEGRHTPDNDFELIIYHSNDEDDDYVDDYDDDDDE